ncbi:MAG TPA: RNA polymerase sporulation sigma factor SigH [Armatimonadota bacterium]|nr:RNA polymerase sporulation sigma factor SigH [Armatimonadota bacterium]
MGVHFKLTDQVSVEIHTTPACSIPDAAEALENHVEGGHYVGLCARDDLFVTFYGISDEDIVAYAQRTGSSRATEHLMTKYKGLVEGKARSYYLRGADHEDVVQEGLIGLFKAIRDYKPDRQSRFKAFAELCVTRQIITAVKTATRQKHIPLNDYVPLDKPLFPDDSDTMLIDALVDSQAIDPENEVLNRELSEYLASEAQNDLSELECQVLRRYIDGKSYREMAGELGCRTKSIDNALQRAKRKIGLKFSKM